jgi:hypothetical protein
VSRSEQAVEAHVAYNQAHGDASQWTEDSVRELQRCLSSGGDQESTEEKLAVVKVADEFFA